jgi:uncharacterized membrane protein HdeD (DUF308 family)
VMLIGAWAIMHGIFEIAGALRLRREIDGEWMLILGGFVSVLFGVAALVFPAEAAVALIWVVAVYAILFGIFMIALAIRFKGLRVHA